VSGSSSQRDNQTRSLLTKSKSIGLPDGLVRTTLEPYQVVVSDAQIEAIRKYVNLLLLWNHKVSLTSIVDPGEILDRHFGESMFAAAKFSILKGRLADVGSGAGFPGLALKIIRPELHVTLIEANAKKSAFLAEVARDLGLNGVDVLRARYEDLPLGAIQADFIAARAVGRLPQLLEWVRGSLSPAGQMVLWLGAQDAENILRVREWNWTGPVPIPRSRRRVLLAGQKPAP